MPTANRSSRSSLNAIGTLTNNKPNNTLTVTTAIVTLPTPSTTPETETPPSQSTSGTISPPKYGQTQNAGPDHNQGNVIRISTL